MAGGRCGGNHLQQGNILGHERYRRPVPDDRTMGKISTMIKNAGASKREKNLASLSPEQRLFIIQEGESVGLSAGLIWGMCAWHRSGLIMPPIRLAGLPPSDGEIPRLLDYLPVDLWTGRFGG